MGGGGGGTSIAVGNGKTVGKSGAIVCFSGVGAERELERERQI